MHRTTRLKITDLNPHVICVLCGGYFVDASTIIECLHSFCKTCILRYLETSKLCPICDVMVHKTRPHQNIRADKTLQDLVFKLVPGLYRNEMKRRRIFYATSPTKDAPKAPSEARGDEMAERFIYTADENISLSLEYCQEGIPDPEVLRRMRQENLQKELTDTKNGGKRDIRYLQCPAAVTVGHLKKFLRLKYDLPSNYVLDVFHTDETLRDYYSLMDIAYIYTWRRRGPLKLYYTIYEKSLKRSLVSSTTQESDISSEIPAKTAKKNPCTELEMTKSETAKPSSDSKVKDIVLSKEKPIISSKEKSIFCSKEKSIVCAKEKSVCAKDKVVCAKEKSIACSKGQMSMVSKTNPMTNSNDNMRSTEPKHLSVATVARTVAAIKEPDSKKQPENKKPVSDFKKPTSEPKKTVPDGKKIVSETKKNTPDAKKNGIDTKKNGVDAKKGVLDAKKSALDAKKVVQEVKKQMTEVKKPLQEVRKLAPEVKKTSNELKKPNPEPRRIEPKKPAMEIRKQPVEIKTKLAEIKKVPNDTKKTPEGKKLMEIKKQQQNDPKKVENGKVNSDVRKPHSVGRKQAEPKKLSVPNMNGHYTNGHGAYDLTRGHLDESGIFKIPRRDEPLNLVKKDKSQPLKLNGGFSPRPDMNVVT